MLLGDKKRYCFIRSQSPNLLKVGHYTPKNATKSAQKRCFQTTTAGFIIVPPMVPGRVRRCMMNDFPEFMKNPVNKVASGSQFTKDIEGYVFDGADSSQMIFWTNEAGGKSIEHTHAYDEYVVVVQGQYTVIVGEIEFPLTAGKEFFIKKAPPTAGFPNRVPGQFMPSAASGPNGQKKKGLAPPLNYAVIQRVFSESCLKVPSPRY